MIDDSHLEAPYVGNPPDNTAPDNWISDEDRRGLETIVEIADSGVDELKAYAPDRDGPGTGTAVLDVDLQALPAFLKTSVALSIEAQGILDRSCWDD